MRGGRKRELGRVGGEEEWRSGRRQGVHSSVPLSKKGMNASPLSRYLISPTESSLGNL